MTIASTNQAIFDRVATHLLTQGRRSKKFNKDSSETVCLYRGPKGTSCAVGCLIDDEAYTPDLENHVAHHFGVKAALRKSGVDVSHWTTLHLLAALQRVHDSVHPNGWRSALRDLASHYELDMKEVKT